jgi:hypothetical protein
LGGEVILHVIILLELEDGIQRVMAGEGGG